MDQIAPYPETFILPPDTTLALYAAEQRDRYEPLASIKTADGHVLSQWRPDPLELQRLIDGEPITLIVHTFNQPLQPVSLGVGGFDLT